ncbi:MAG: type II secretion system F family protein [Solirubrobacteraceae bacterium]|nr:type II secretion system F family protein [Solirubrobacteraceae bacterium]
MPAVAAAVALAGALTHLYEVSTASGGQAGAAARGGARPEQLVDLATRSMVARNLLIGLVVACLVVAITSPGKALLAGALAVSVSIVRGRGADRGRRRAREAGVPTLARSLADALRGGASIRAALAAAAEDRSIPAELRATVRSEAAGLALGAPLRPTLTALGQAGGPGMRLLCGTVAMHLDAGGALASQLERLAADGDASRKVDQDRVAATAQARATVRVVAALPLLAMGGAQLASPGFLAAVIGHPIALLLLIVGLVLEVAAVLVARAIVGTAR